MKKEESMMIDEVLTRSEQKHRDIVIAAEQVFIEYGYQQTSMNKIAEVAHVTKRTVYKKFPSKQALFEYVFREIINDLYDQATLVYSNKQPLKEQLRNMLLILWSTVSQMKLVKFKRVAIAEYVNTPEFMSPLIDEIKSRDEGLKAWLKGGMECGHIVNCNEKFAHEFIVGLIEQFAQVPRIFDHPSPEGETKDYIINEITDIFIMKYGAQNP
ncbi:MAG: TetR/AcrR family transcriptional regulator [Pseudomonadales bacterium]|nr:TetR/AcrR family transcriptional regulator [Pseudomonadales bacterium]